MFVLQNKSGVPSIFHQTPPNLNHSHLNQMNMVSQKAGFKDDVFKNLEVLPEDNGERFMSQHWLQQKDQNFKHENEDVPTGDFGRCMCQLCGGKLNPCLDTSMKVSRHASCKKNERKD